MKKDFRNLEEERNDLRNFLWKYNDCKKRKKQLETRLKDIQREMSMPIGGIGYSPTPHSTTNNVGAGAAGFTIKMAEIEERIIKQNEEMERAMIAVMDVMNFLDEGDTDRRIMEYRYIDGKDWRSIESLENMTRQAANNHLNAGLDKLLGFKKIRTMIKEQKKIEEDEKSLHNFTY